MTDTNLIYPFEFEGGKKAIANEVNANFEAVKCFANGVNQVLRDVQSSISELENRSTRNVFEIFYAISTKVPTGAYPLWTGETINNCKSLFPDFWKEALNRKKLGTIKTVESNETYNQVVSTYGQCGSFYIDELNGHIRLPKITKFIEGIEALGDLAKAVKAGLPNIKGNIYNSASYTQEPTADGAFNVNKTGAASTSSMGKTSRSTVSFDASRSNSLFGASNTVQPASMKLPLFIQVANNVVEISEMNTQLIAEELSEASAQLSEQYQGYKTALETQYETLGETVLEDADRAEAAKTSAQQSQMASSASASQAAQSAAQAAQSATNAGQSAVAAESAKSLAASSAQSAAENAERVLDGAPQITVATSTDTEYTLRIKTLDDEFTTVNLHGPQGAQGIQGPAGEGVPSQTGNAGKYLTTDGETAFWGGEDLLKSPGDTILKPADLYRWTLIGDDIFITEGNIPFLNGHDTNGKYICDKIKFTNLTVYAKNGSFSFVDREGNIYTANIDHIYLTTSTPSSNLISGDVYVWYCRSDDKVYGTNDNFTTKFELSLPILYKNAESKITTFNKIGGIIAGLDYNDSGEYLTGSFVSFAYEGNVLNMVDGLDENYSKKNMAFITPFIFYEGPRMLDYAPFDFFEAVGPYGPFNVYNINYSSGENLYMMEGKKYNACKLFTIKHSRINGASNITIDYNNNNYLTESTNELKDYALNAFTPKIGAYTNLTVGSSGASYTAQDNGYINLGFKSSASGQTFSVYTGVNSAGISTGSNQTFFIHAPVKKGASYQVSYASGMQVTIFAFIATH